MNRESAGSIALGVWLFVLLGAAIVVLNFPAPVGVPPLFNYMGIALWYGGYMVVLGLMLKGWRAGFPRWVYPYLGYALIFPLFISRSSAPDLELFSIPLLRSGELWGWRAFVPLELVILLGLVLSSPPWGHLVRLISHAWNDWTVAVFALFGLLPLVVFISLDEVEHSFRVWPQMAGLLLLCLGALLSMRLTHPGARCLALLVCAFLAVAITSGSAEYYWTTHYVNLATGERRLLTTPVDWQDVLVKAFAPAGYVALFLLLPLPLGLARLICDWSRARRPSLP